MLGILGLELSDQCTKIQIPEHLHVLCFRFFANVAFLVVQRVR